MEFCLDRSIDILDLVGEFWSYLDTVDLSTRSAIAAQSVTRFRGRAPAAGSGHNAHSRGVRTSPSTDCRGVSDRAERFEARARAVPGNPGACRQARKRLYTVQ